MLPTSVFTSRPVFFMVSISSMGTPSILSVVSTRRPVRAQSILGTKNVESSSKLERSSSPAAASSRKSISSATVLFNVCTTSTNLRRCMPGTWFSVVLASQSKNARSRAKASSTLGLKIFTATGLPSTVVAKWTWAIDAAAIASSVKNLKIFSNGWPNSCTTAWRASFPENGGS